MKQRPLIITGLQVTREQWTLDMIEREAALSRVDVKSVKRDSCEWASLEIERTTTVSEFIRSVRSVSDTSTGCPERGYLFDWSLPQVFSCFCCTVTTAAPEHASLTSTSLQMCPALASQLIIPRYFACDLLQQLPEGCMYRVSHTFPAFK
jgi:hypothetical protein